VNNERFAIVGVGPRCPADRVIRPITWVTAVDNVPDNATFAVLSGRKD
jgi:hypothetical protein